MKIELPSTSFADGYHYLLRLILLGIRFASLVFEARRPDPSPKGGRGLHDHPVSNIQLIQLYPASSIQ